MSSTLKLLADENIEEEVVNILSQAGHDVEWMKTVNPGALDPAVAEYATNQARVVLSYDVEFASDIRMAVPKHHGFVLARLGRMEKHLIAELFLQTLAMRQDWRSCIAIFKPGSVRFSTSN